MMSTYTLRAGSALSRLGLAVLLTCLVGSAPRAAHADKMEFFETYTPYTGAKGEVEVELWNDFFTAGRPRSGEEHFGHQLSVEYGITDRWMAEVYAQYNDNPNGRGIEYAGTRLETRYRLTPYSPKGINLGLYGEYAKSSLKGKADELEAKLLISKEFGEVNFTINPRLERDCLPGARPEFGYSAGLSCPVGTSVVSLETLVKPTDRQVYIIPGVHFAVSKHDYVGVGVSLQTSPAPFNATLRTFWSHEF
jgi:hypothetical protein